MTRVNAARLAVGLALFLTVGPARAGKEPAGFLTNIGLLDALTRQAVEALLDSLAFAPGDTVSIVQSGGSEGDAFVSEAIARSLAARGCIAHMTEMPPSAPVSETPAPQVPAPRQEEEEEEEEPELPMFGSLFPDTISQGRADSIAQGLIDTTQSGFGAALAGSLAGDDRGGEEPAIQEPEEQGQDEIRPGAGQAEGDRETPGATPAAPAGAAGAAAAGAAPAAERRPVPVRRIYPAGNVLEFRLLEFGVTYPSAKRKLLILGKGAVHRLGGVYIQASRIDGPEGKIVNVASGQAHRHDELSGNSRALAEGAAYPFMKPTVPASNLGRIVEPIAVLGIVSSLVYLFYQNQN